MKISISISLFIVSMQTLTPTEKIKNQCLSISQLETQYPEYSTKTLENRFRSESIIGEGNFGKVIIGNLKEKEGVIKKIHLKSDIIKIIT